jgi:hypothetical protein
MGISHAKFEVLGRSIGVLAARLWGIVGNFMAGIGYYFTNPSQKS